MAVGTRPRPVRSKSTTPNWVWSAIAAAANPAFIRVGFAGLAQSAPWQEQRRIAPEAWRIDLTTPRTVMESFDVLRVGASEIAVHRDGLSLTDPVAVALERLGFFNRKVAPMGVCNSPPQHLACPCNPCRRPCRSIRSRSKTMLISTRSLAPLCRATWSRCGPGGVRARGGAVAPAAPAGFHP